MMALDVLPRTMLSSTRRTFLPLISEAMGLSFWRTESFRFSSTGMMKVRPI